MRSRAAGTHAEHRDCKVDEEPKPTKDNAAPPNGEGKPDEKAAKPKNED